MWRTLLLLTLFALLCDDRMTEAQELVLPPLRPNSLESGELSSRMRVLVREFRFQGNTIFSSAELATLTAPYLNRELTVEQLEEVRRLITGFYLEFGYLNSGAVLPDQDVRDGIVTFQIIEGALSDIRIRGKNRRLRDSYVTSRLRRWAGPPLRVNELKEGLLLLRQDPNVKQVNAELRPGTKPGESYLDVYLQEEQPFRLGLQVDNHRPPSVGAEEIVLFGADRNLTGNGDLLEFSYGIAHNGENGFEFSGADDESGSYILPLHPSGTTIRVFGSRSDTSVVEDPFTTLDIVSEVIRFGAGLRQPVHRTPNQELALGVTIEREYNKSHSDVLTGDELVPGSENGKMYLSVLRFTQEWLDRSQTQVLALRSTFNLGINAFGVTDNGTDRDATFWSWLGQAQYVQRLFNTQNLIILRADGQWTDEPLLALEQLSVGGASSVRGYRENELVRDRGYIGSVEGRVPVLFGKGGVPIVQLAPFFDCGGAWNVDSGTPNPESIFSSGIGILANPNKYVNAEFYWGYRFTHVPNPHDNAQDLGIHFRVTFQAF